MATTNNTDAPLNHGYERGHYTNIAVVTTGNMADSQNSPKKRHGKVVNNKYVTGRIFNDTYTLLDSEEGGVLSDSTEAISYKGSEIGGDSLDPDTWYAVWGMPNKWIYDQHQRYGNCGVDSCLNILSMAGVKDILEFTQEEMDNVIAEHTTHTTDINGNPIERVPHISFIETEQEFTLWAIQNHYCDYWGGSYNSVDDLIPEIDGGTYFGNVGGEQHEYHETIPAISEILTANGVPASVKNSLIKLSLAADVEETSLTDQKEEGQDSNNDEYTVNAMSGNVTITSSDGDDTLLLEGFSKSALDANPYLFARKDDDLYINYSDGNSVIVKGFFTEGEDAPNHLNTVAFSNGETIDLSTWVDQHYVYGEDYVNSNIRTFGSFVTKLATEVMLGHGVVLQGMAETLNGTEDQVEPWYQGPNHAISLVGVVMDYNLEDIVDVVGFYVVDTGGFLPEVDGAQYITVELLHKFLTSAFESENPCTYIETNYVATEENIRAWADHLNLVGNNRKNTLRGNVGNNKIWGKDGNDILYGMAGNDTLSGDNGHDTLYGGTGDNYLYGGSGNDSYVFDAGVDCRDVVIPGSGKDLIRFENYKKGELTFGNNNGDLVISYNNDQGSVTIKDYFSKSLYDNIYKLDDKDTIELTAATDGEWGENAYDFYRDILTQVEIQYDKYVKQNETNNIVGTKLRDSILGAQYADTISAGAGSDKINGGGGNDIIKAGADNDTIYGSYGSDKIYGEGGKNYIIYDSNYGGNDTIYSGSGEDHIVMTDKTREGLIFTKSGNDLVIIYDEDAGSSVTIQNYFAKGGKTSVKDILLAGNDYLDLVQEYNDISSNIVGNVSGNYSAGGAGNDTLLGGAGADNMSGGLGDDVIKAGDGNDTINGGYGNDKLYGGNGDNTFVFTPNSGSDTIYAGGNGQINIDLSGTGIVLNGDKSGFEGSTIKDYAFTRTGNDLIINYAMDPSQEGTSTIVLQKYFKSKNSYNLITDNGTVNLNDVMMIYRGRSDKSNKLKGTKQGDIIFGGDLKDTIKGGDGNDSIAGGLGNDAITGGKGHNTVVYNLGDGKDTITLTKNEQLDIKINGNGITSSDLSYRIYKGNLIISCNGEDILVLKKFGKKDVTTAGGGVDLYLNDTHLYDLRNDIFLPAYDAFTSKKYKYKGKWLAERIDASGLQSATNKKGRGVSINGAGGNDDIIGSDYNDTLKGGDGNDTLTGGYGKNTYDGGKGSDTYNLFTSSNDINNWETAIIKDTGKDGAVDIVNIAKDYDDLSVWFNIDRNGNASYVFNITDESTGDSATVSGVEQINANSGYTYNYTNAALLNEVAGWLASNNFSDVATAMNQATANQINELMAYFNSDNYWTQV